jgi:hypothetical protein
MDFEINLQKVKKFENLIPIIETLLKDKNEITFTTGTEGLILFSRLYNNYLQRGYKDLTKVTIIKEEPYSETLKEQFIKYEFKEKSFKITVDKVLNTIYGDSYLINGSLPLSSVMLFYKE